MSARAVLALLLLLALPGVGLAEVVVEAGHSAHYLANSSDPGVDGAWQAPAFADSGWSSGSYGMGYEDGSGAEALLATPVPVGTLSIYTRARFNVSDLASVTAVGLGADYDDGYAAWLNGVEVFRSDNLPVGPLVWNSDPTVQHESSNGPSADYRPMQDITAAALPALVSGENVLAVGVWNVGAGSSDLVLVPKLELNPLPGVERGPWLQLATPSSVIVRWRTAAPTDSVVRYGPTPSDLTLSVEDPTLVTEHSITLTGLVSEATSYYSVGSTTATFAGGDSEHRFVTPPAAGSAQPARIWVIGDSGTADANAARVRSAYTEHSDCRPTDLWLMLGDNAYEDGTDGEFQRAVFDMYPGLLRSAVVWPTFGNHDSHSAASATQTGPYYEIFNLPRLAEAGGVPSGTEAYYSFDFANIHFICLDSDDSSRVVDGAMYSWLETDLADTTRDWIVAYFHHPPYTKGSHNSDTESKHIEMRERFIPVLEDAGVDLVLSGHSHSYERSTLIDGHYGDSNSFGPAHQIDPSDGRLDGDGAYGKTPGGPTPRAGAVYTVAGSSGKTSGGPLDHEAMLVSLNVLGSVILEVSGDRLDATFLDDAGDVRDHWTLLKGPDVPPLGAEGVTALALTGSSIEVTWSDRSANEDGFSIERTEDDLSWTEVGTVGADVTAFNDTGLEPDRTYRYRVQAFNVHGRAILSDCGEATTLSCSAVPTETSQLLAAKSGGDALTLSWGPVGGASGYRVARGGLGGFYDHLVDDGAGAGVCTTVEIELVDGDDVASPASYYYYVAAVNDCGVSGSWGRDSTGVERPEPLTSPSCP